MTKLYGGKSRASPPAQYFVNGGEAALTLTPVYMAPTLTRLDYLASVPAKPKVTRSLTGPEVKWKDQQAQLWARAKKETRKGKQRWRVGDLLADERCSPAVLDFLRTTYVGRAAPPVEES